MRNINKIIVVTLTVFFITSCANLPLYQSKEINSKDEISDLRYYNKENKILYDVYDDENNIYVNIKTSNYYSQVKILEMGFTLWIDQKAKKKKDKGIVFPQKQEFKRNQQNRSLNNTDSFNREEQRIEQLRTQFQLSIKNIVLIGMDGENSKRVFNTELENSDIISTITFDTFNRLNYLAIIPKSKIFTDGKYNNNTFSIGIESGFMEMNSNKGSSGGKSGGGSRSGGMGGGKGQSNRSGGNMEQRSALSEPIKIWFSVSL